MQIKRTITLCLLLLTAHAAAAQFVCTYRHIITVYSTNGDYCARATPYYNFDLSPYGKTEVFNTRTNQLLYTIPECLSKGFLFLSNDGASVLHLVNLEYKSDEEAFSHSLTLYQNGTKAKQYNKYMVGTYEWTETGKRMPTDVIQFSNWNGALFGKTDKAVKHPTTKPIPLLEYLIKTYSNEGFTVLDNCMGSGSTGVACMNTGRRFIGMELDKGYFEIAKQRISEAANG